MTWPAKPLRFFLFFSVFLFFIFMIVRSCVQQNPTVNYVAAPQAVEEKQEVGSLAPKVEIEADVEGVEDKKIDNGAELEGFSGKIQIKKTQEDQIALEAKTAVIESKKEEAQPVAQKPSDVAIKKEKAKKVSAPKLRKVKKVAKVVQKKQKLKKTQNQLTRWSKSMTLKLTGTEHEIDGRSQAILKGAAKVIPKQDKKRIVIKSKSTARAALIRSHLLHQGVVSGTEFELVKQKLSPGNFGVVEVYTSRF